MDNLVSAFAHLYSQHKDAISPDGVDAERKKFSTEESLCHGALENTKELCGYGHYDCSK